MKLLLLFEFFRQINQVKPVGRAGKGGVKPAVEIFAKHLFGDIAYVQEDIHPLAALRLVAGDGVCEFDLQDVVVCGSAFIFFIFPAFVGMSS